jgi:hypothetical protein
MEYGFVRLFLGVAFTVSPRGKRFHGGGSASGEQQDPTGVADHGCLNSMMGNG